MREHEDGHPGQQDRVAADAVGGAAGRVGAGGVGGAHHGEHGGHPRSGHARGVGPQQQEGLRRPCRRNGRGHAGEPPERCAEPAEFGAPERPGPRRRRGRCRRLPHAQRQDRHREPGRHHRHPQRVPQVDGGGEQRERQQRPRHGAGGIERLAQAEGRAPSCRRRELRHQRVARGAADTLADPVRDPGGCDRRHAGRQREHRLGEGREAVAGEGERLAPAQAVGERSGEHAHRRRRGLGGALEDPDGGRRGAEDRRQVQREDAVDQLGRGVHQQRDDAERPDAPWQGPQRGGLGAGRWRHGGGSRGGDGSPCRPGAAACQSATRRRCFFSTRTAR